MSLAEAVVRRTGEGLHCSLAGSPDAALRLLAEAVDLAELHPPTLPLPETPHAVAALVALAANQPDLGCVQVTYVNPETGGDAQNILGFYALMLRPGQTLTLPARSPAQVFHLIEGGVDVSTCSKTFGLVEADTCCAPGYESVTLFNRQADKPSFVFIADESPLHRKLGVYEVR